MSTLSLQTVFYSAIEIVLLLYLLLLLLLLLLG